MEHNLNFQTREIVNKTHRQINYLGTVNYHKTEHKILTNYLFVDRNQYVQILLDITTAPPKPTVTEASRYNQLALRVKVTYLC